MYRPEPASGAARMADRTGSVRTGLVVGATGLVGRHLVRILLEDDAYDRVAVLSRRPFPDPALRRRLEERLVDFDRLDQEPGALRADHVFCALGTTMRKAGSRDRFRQVDLDYVRRVAELARGAGARHFALVSAVGADPGSRFFYSRIKGAAERAVIATGIPSVSIVRPSVLGGDRDESRPAERLAQWVLRSAPARWRTVDARDVARALVRLAREEEPGVRIVESRSIPDNARERPRGR